MPESGENLEKIIAILPCSDADAQTQFYKHLGFTLVGKYTRSYLVFRYGDLVLHFFGSRMFPPEGNPSMCIIQTDDLERLYDAFTTGLKTGTGKIPRSGFPKITKIRELSEDRRFTLADPSGNTIYVTEPKPQGSGTFFREIDSAPYAKKFAALYDLVYSKQDMALADKVLTKLLPVKEQLSDLDRAKLLLLQREICASPDVEAELAGLAAGREGDGWERVLQKLKQEELK